MTFRWTRTRVGDGVLPAARRSLLGAVARAFPALGVFGSAAAGCATPAADSPTAAGPAVAPVQILDAWGPGPARERQYADWSAGMAERVPTVKADFIMLSEGGVAAKLTAMIAAGTPPDVTLGANPEFALRGELLNLDPFLRKDKEAMGWQWSPASWEYVNVVLDNGTKMVWALPGNPAVRTIYVNLDLLARAGITYAPTEPWTWDDFRQHARRLTRRLPDGGPEQVGFKGFGTGTIDLHPFVTHAGGDFFHRDPKTGWVDRATFTAPQTLAAIEYFYELGVKDRVGLLPGEPTAGFQFVDGRVAMEAGYPNLMATLQQAKPAFRWDLMPFPLRKQGDKWPNQFVNGTAVGSILQGTKYPEPSFAAVRYLAGPEGHLIRQRANGGGPIPPAANWKAAWEEWLQPPPANKTLLQKTVNGGTLAPWLKIKDGLAEVNKAYADEMTALLTGKSGTRQFADGVNEQINRRLAVAAK